MGKLQRIGIARACGNEPRKYSFLMNLQHQLSGVILEIIERSHFEDEKNGGNLLLVITTHDMRFRRTTCRLVAFNKDGKIVPG